MDKGDAPKSFHFLWLLQLAFWSNILLIGGFGVRIVAVGSLEKRVAAYPIRLWKDCLEENFFEELKAKGGNE